MPDTPGGEQRVEAAARAIHETTDAYGHYVNPHDSTLFAVHALEAADAVDPLRSPATTDDRAAIARLVGAVEKAITTSGSWAGAREAVSAVYKTHDILVLALDSLPPSLK